jgi:hypothetical protein
MGSDGGDVNHQPSWLLWKLRTAAAVRSGRLDPVCWRALPRCGPNHPTRRFGSWAVEGNSEAMPLA